MCTVCSVYTRRIVKTEKGEDKSNKWWGIQYESNSVAEHHNEIPQKEILVNQLKRALFTIVIFCTFKTSISNALNKFCN